jgi:uncharacterized protein YecT (DUF1311 family)
MKIFLLLFFLLALTAACHSQEKQKHEEDECCCSTMETNMCLTKVMKKLDGELNESYKKALQHAIQPDKLRTAQRQWLRFRDAQCASEAGEYEGGSIVGQVAGFCITRLTRRRIEDLQLFVKE